LLACRKCEDLKDEHTAAKTGAGAERPLCAKSPGNKVKRLCSSEAANM